MPNNTPKNVLITGAAKRLGAASARALHARGCNIVVHCHQSLQQGEQLVAELNTLRPASAVLMSADLLDLTAVQHLAAAAEQVWGGIDILVHNASAFYPESVAQTTEQSWEQLMGSNLKAPFFLTQALAPSLTARHGCIVHMVDIHAEKGLPGYPVYSIAKAGLEAMTRVLAKELAPAVRVNGIAPGAILWPEQGGDSDAQQQILQRIALQRVGGIQDITRALCFLCFEADYMTGQILKIDGGRTLFT